MSYEGHNVIEMDPYRVGRAIRAADIEASDRAIEEMKEATHEFTEAHKSGDWFATQRAIDRCDAARLRLLELMRCAL